MPLFAPRCGRGVLSTARDSESRWSRWAVTGVCHWLRPCSARGP